MMIIGSRRSTSTWIHSPVSRLYIAQGFMYQKPPSFLLFRCSLRESTCQETGLLSRSLQKNTGLLVRRGHSRSCSNKWSQGDGAFLLEAQKILTKEDNDQ